MAFRSEWYAAVDGQILVANRRYPVGRNRNSDLSILLMPSYSKEGGGGGRGSSAVERATPGEEVPGSTRCGRPLPNWVGVCIM